MNIKTILKGTKSIKKIYIRLYQGKIDIIADTGLVCLESGYNLKKDIFVDSELNIKISELRAFILKRFNQDYSNGEIISNTWLKSIILDCFNRNLEVESSGDSKRFVFISEFAKYWMDNHSKKWKVSARKLMDDRLSYQYSQVIDHIKSFEKKRKSKIAFKEIDSDLLYEFVEYFEGLNYNASTIERMITRFKFFCFRAVEQNIKVNSGFKARVYLDKNQEVEGVYLTEGEIQQIYDLDLSHDDYLDNVRDNLVLNCYLGLRISDFMTSLNIDNIKDGMVSIKTSKTGAFVRIPIHNLAQKILNKRFGQLPKKIGSAYYNQKIKVVCQLANIDELVYGMRMNPDTRRKEYGYFKKYELITSHVSRKSFATLLYGKVPNEVIQSVCGWSKNSMMLQHYNQTSKIEYAEQLAQYWGKIS
jgi:integrase